MLPSSNRHRGGVLVLVLLVVCAPLVGTASVAAQSQSASLVTVDGTVRVHAVEGATVRGTTDLAPGTNVSVRLRSAGDTSPRFLKNRVVSVGENGTFAATFNFSAMSPGDTFSVTVQHDGTVLASAEGRVVAQDVPASPTPAQPDGSTETTLPGFGIVAAVVALCGGGWLLRRR